MSSRMVAASAAGGARFKTETLYKDLALSGTGTRQKKRLNRVLGIGLGLLCSVLSVLNCEFGRTEMTALHQTQRNRATFPVRWSIPGEIGAIIHVRPIDRSSIAEMTDEAATAIRVLPTAVQALALERMTERVSGLRADALRKRRISDHLVSASVITLVEGPGHDLGKSCSPEARARRLRH